MRLPPSMTTPTSCRGCFQSTSSLRQLNTFLKSLSISENGYAFILDSNGLMIANSLEQSAYLATSELRPTHQTVYEPGRVKFERLSATAANHPFLQEGRPAASNPVWFPGGDSNAPGR